MAKKKNRFSLLQKLFNRKLKSNLQAIIASGNNESERFAIFSCCEVVLKCTKLNYLTGKSIWIAFRFLCWQISKYIKFCVFFFLLLMAWFGNELFLHSSQFANGFVLYHHLQLLLKEEKKQIKRRKIFKRKKNHINVKMAYFIHSFAIFFL